METMSPDHSGIVGSPEKDASFGVVLGALVDHLGRGCLHEPGLFRVSRSTSNVRELWADLSSPPPQSIQAASAGAPLDTASAAAWHAACLRRLAEVSDPALVAAVLLLHLRAHPPLLPGRAFQNLLAWEKRHAPPTDPLRKVKREAHSNQETTVDNSLNNASNGCLELDSSASEDVPSDDEGDDSGSLGSSRGHDLRSEEAALAGARQLLDEVALPAWRQLSSLSALLAAAARMANLNGMPAAALAFVVAPALSRPDGSAFMAVRHLEGLPALRRFLTILIEHHADVFAEAASPTIDVAAPPTVSVPVPLEIPSPNPPVPTQPQHSRQIFLPDTALESSHSRVRMAESSINASEHRTSPRSPNASDNKGGRSREGGGTSKSGCSSPRRNLSPRTALAAAVRHVPGATPAPSSEVSEVAKVLSGSVSAFLASARASVSTEATIPSSGGRRHRSNEPARTFNLTPDSLTAALASPAPSTGPSSFDASPSKAFSSSLLTRPKISFIGLPSSMSLASPALREASSSAELSSQWIPAVQEHRLRSAAERRRTVHACRALRAQIRRFEDAFTAQHSSSSPSINAAPLHSPGSGASPVLRRSNSSGAPKGADRLPLESTYAQYREWKKCIRHHAASQIQALVRGAAARRLNSSALATAVALIRSCPRAHQSANDEASPRAPAIAANAFTTVVPVNSAGKHASSEEQPVALSLPENSVGNQIVSPKDASCRASSSSKSKSKKKSSTPTSQQQQQQQQQPLSVGRGVSPRVLWSNPKSGEGPTYSLGIAGDSAAVPEVSNPPVTDAASDVNPSAVVHSVLATPEIVQEPAAPAAVPALEAAPNVPSGEASTGQKSARPEAEATTGAGDDTPAPEPAPRLEERIEALEAEKKRVKNLLKTYDAAFAQRHEGRLPTKAEKEPIRALYEDYHRVKQALQAALDQQQAAAATAAAADGGALLASKREVPAGESSHKISSSGNGHNTSSNGSDTTTSNAVVSMGGPPVVPVSKRAQPRQQHASKDSNRGSLGDDISSATSNGSASISDKSSSGRVRTNAWTKEAPASPSDKVSGKAKAAGDRSTMVVPPESVANAHGEEVRTLLLEKRSLHDMLKRYEREFEATHGRVVKTLDDIAVVQGDYNRYKQLKARLASLQANRA